MVNHSKSEVLNYWQIGSGSYGRDYAKDFIRFGMAFGGGDVQTSTMDKVNVGDRVIMKRGMSEVVAAGCVVERYGRCKGVNDKDWLRDFDGWDLGAYCFVEWHVPDQPIAGKGLTRATIQNVHQQHLKDLADQIIENVPSNPEPEPEPHQTEKVEDDRILEFLIRQGLRPGAAEELTTAFNRIRFLARYYYHHCWWDDIREHETRAFLIIPLLLALGWAEQQIKIELPVKGQKRRADVACFTKPYYRKKSREPNNDDCVLILESKGFSQGLYYAPEQAIYYATQFPNCQVVAVSNGYCYKAFRRQEGGSFNTEKPSAYLNLLNPQDRYPLDPDNVDGCLETLKLLLPSFW